MFDRSQALTALAAVLAGACANAERTADVPSPATTLASVVASTTVSPSYAQDWTEGSSLRVEATQVEAGLAPLLQPIAPRVRLCYEDAKRRRPALQAEIAVSLALAEDRHARVTAEEQSPDVDAAFTGCIVAAIERVVFTKTAPREARFVLRFVAADDRPPTDTRAASLEEARAYGIHRREKADSELPADVQFVLRRSQDRIYLCYLAGLARDPKLFGTLRIDFAIGRDGQVTDARASGTIADDFVGACAATTFASLLFPPPPAGVFRGSRTFTFAPE